MAPKVLAVDDNGDALFAIEALLQDAGYEVATASDGEATIEKARSFHPDVILLDVVMPKLDGYEVTRRLKADPLLKYCTIILLTGKDDLEDLEFGLQQGADDHLKKPANSRGPLARLKAALRLRSLYKKLSTAYERNEILQSTLKERCGFDNIIGKSAKMQDVYTLIERVSDASLPVLLLGESGTGKELVARAIHGRSGRTNAGFIAQNCAAFSEHLLESELFGHRRGAFTGALRDKEGLIEAANDGTFFLDEIGEMSLPLQAKLLRVIQEGTFTPVGDTKERVVDVRFIAATHRNLHEMIKHNLFREDLFYRLNVITIELPPLRERRDDIPLLVEFFMNRKGLKKSISQEVLERFIDFAWPGNIRQLQNELERALLMLGNDHEITLKHVSPLLRDGKDSISARESNAGSGEAHSLKSTEVTRLLDSESSLNLRSAVEEVKKLITSALSQTAGNKSEAARLLGISRSSLIEKAKGYGVG